MTSSDWSSLLKHAMLDVGCHASVEFPRGPRIEVQGADAAEVERVARALADQAYDRHAPQQFIAALDEKIRDEATPEEQRTRLRQLRGTASTVSKEVMADVLANVITRQAGL